MTIPQKHSTMKTTVRKGSNTMKREEYIMADHTDNLEEMEYDPDIYTLIDEDGTEQSFELLNTMELDGERYFALLPYFEDPEDAVEDSGELVVLKAELVDGEEMMATIDDDEEYERVGNLFLERVNEMFEDDFDEDDE